MFKSFSLNSSCRVKDAGQAMAEFVIILFVIMIMCSGMLYANRLLSFDFWARQEARFMAFEQTWVPAWYESEFGDMVEEDGDKFKRARAARRINPTREAEDDGDLHGLLMAYRPIGGSVGSDEEVSSERVGSELTPPIMIARKPTGSVWSDKTSDWLSRNRRKRSLSFVESAYASQSIRARESRNGPQWTEDEPPRDRDRLYYPSENVRLIRGITRLLERGGFGENFCQVMVNNYNRYGFRGDASPFAEDDCGQKYDQKFGEHIVQNVDFPKIYREWEYQMESGIDTGQALQVTLEKVVAGHYYSFFDQVVRFVMDNGALPFALAGDRLGAVGIITDDAYTRMLTDWRYAGASPAILAVSGAVGAAALGSPWTRDWESQKNLEQDIYDVLHADTENFGGVANGFWVNSVLYFPLPPDYTVFFGNLLEGVMENVLAEEEDLMDPLIEESNKRVQVDYPAEAGLFGAARRRWDTDKTLTANYYLVTQPWHITRREDYDEDFRELGSEFDSAYMDTSEGVLRRRVFGLWLLPSRPGALVTPLTGAIPFVGGVAETFLGFTDSILAEIKSFIFNNPLRQIADAVNQIPMLNSFIDFTLPNWPAVRPASYPGSQELVDDELMRDGRNFQKYIDEQKEFNPEPKPKFN